MASRLGDLPPIRGALKHSSSSGGSATHLAPPAATGNVVGPTGTAASSPASSRGNSDNHLLANPRAARGDSARLHSQQQQQQQQQHPTHGRHSYSSAPSNNTSGVALSSGVGSAAAHGGSTFSASMSTSSIRSRMQATVDATPDDPSLLSPNSHLADLAGAAAAAHHADAAHGRSFGVKSQLSFAGEEEEQRASGIFGDLQQDAFDTGLPTFGGAAQQPLDGILGLLLERCHCATLREKLEWADEHAVNLVRAWIVGDVEGFVKSFRCDDSFSSTTTDDGMDLGSSEDNENGPLELLHDDIRPSNNASSEEGSGSAGGPPRRRGGNHRMRKGTQVHGQDGVLLMRSRNSDIVAAAAGGSGGPEHMSISVTPSASGRIPVPQQGEECEFSVNGRPLTLLGRRHSNVNFLVPARLTAGGGGSGGGSGSGSRPERRISLNTSLLGTSLQQGIMKRRASMLSMSRANTSMKSRSHLAKRLHMKIQERQEEQQLQRKLTSISAKDGGARGQRSSGSNRAALRSQGGSSQFNEVLSDFGDPGESDDEDEPRLFELSYGLQKAQFRTSEQAETDAFLSQWRLIGGLLDLLRLLLFLVNFFAIPLRVGIGSANLPPGLLHAEHALDGLLLVVLAVNLLRPAEIHGHMTTSLAAIREHYLAGEFRLDAIAIAPLQIVLLPLHAGGVVPIEAVDFCRVNRLLYISRFSSIYDDLVDQFLASVHPILMRIFKFVFIIFFYAIITAAPMFMVVRADGAQGRMWINQGLSKPEETLDVAYLKTALYALSVAAGRNFPLPTTEPQILVMTVVSILSLASMSVIIAGVTAMVLSLVERTSRLSHKVDEVIHQMTHMRLPSYFIEEVCQYYRYMFNAFNTFDYQSGDDFLDDLPPDLLDALNTEVHMSTVRQIPLFAGLDDDPQFVREMASRLDMVLLMPGTIIFTKGEEGREMYFVSKGEASVLLDGKTEFAVLRQGSFFGEQSLLFSQPRGATVVAKTLCQVYALSKKSFEEMIDIRPDALQSILDITMARSHENRTAAAVQRRETEERGGGGVEGVVPVPLRSPTLTEASTSFAKTDLDMLTRESRFDYDRAARAASLPHAPWRRRRVRRGSQSGTNDSGSGSGNESGSGSHTAVPCAATTTTTTTKDDDEAAASGGSHWQRGASAEFDNPFNAPGGI